MISLKQNNEPYEIELIGNLRLTIRPLKTLDMAIAQAAAKKRVDDLEKSIRCAVESGFPPERDLDFQNGEQRQALYMELLIKELAVRHIVKWSGVEAPEGGKDAELTPENICALMEAYPVGELFYSSITIRHYLLASAKEGCGVVAGGISSQAAAPNIAKDVQKMDSLVQRVV